MKKTFRVYLNDTLTGTVEAHSVVVAFDRVLPTLKTKPGDVVGLVNDEVGITIHVIPSPAVDTTAVAAARAKKRAGNRVVRLRSTHELIARAGAKKTTTVGEFTIETWFMKEGRHWVTQTKDAAGNQVGDAKFAGNNIDAVADHAAAVHDVTLPADVFEAEPETKPEPESFTWRAVVEVTVAPSWVADGFELDAERLAELVRENILPYAFDAEKKVSAKVVKKPSKKRLAAAWRGEEPGRGSSPAPGPVRPAGVMSCRSKPGYFVGNASDVVKDHLIDANGVTLCGKKTGGLHWVPNFSRVFDADPESCLICAKRAGLKPGESLSFKEGGQS